MSDVFVSYARSTELEAMKIADALRAKGYRVWRDDEIPAHRAYADVIEDRLKSSKAVVVMWSADAAKSQWVRSEADAARAAGTLIQVSVDGTLPPMPFDQVECAELRGWDGDANAFGWRKLADSVAALVGPVEPRSSEGQPRRRSNSICVLPFVNMSGDAEQEYFSDGISEDITTDLSKISALSVAARNTAFMFKGQPVNVCDLAKKLGVSHVLEGSVRRAGGRVRINAQLIDGASGDHIWAERFDRDLTDIFAIQDELSKAIVDALKVKLLPEERKAIADRGTTNADAYNLYLMARQYWASGNDGDPRRDAIILRMCRSALEIDPNYARAWSLLALTQSAMHRRNVDVEETGIAAAEKALEFDPGMAEPHCVIADNFAKQGRFEEADTEIELALGLDPESWEVNKEAALISYRQGRTEQAMARFAKAASLMESDYRSAGMMLSCARGLGDSAAIRNAAQMTVQRAERAVSEDRSNGAALAYGAGGLAALGELERAKEWMRRALLIDPENPIMLYNLACLATTEFDDSDLALELVKPFMTKANLYQVKHVENDCDMVKLRQDPRFQAMIEETKQRLAVDQKPVEAIPAEVEERPRS